jgi:hypothetical protein
MEKPSSLLEAKIKATPPKKENGAALSSTK